MIFTYNQKQEKAVELYNNPDKIYILAEGGSRSGKTFSICDYIIARAVKYPKTRHLICRQSKVSCKNTVWTQTLLEILENYGNYPKEIWDEDKSNTRINFWNGSSIWAGGFDNKIHQDGVLGSQWATVYINEALDLNFSIFNKLISRLNFKGINLKLFTDCNPKAPSHWLSKWFKKHTDPLDNEPLNDKLKSRIASLHFHPLDNQDNLSKDYLEQLDNLKGLARKRFWDGLWAEDLEGLVYQFERKINVVEDPIKLQPEAETFTTWDFGVSDPTFIIVGQILQIPKTEDNKAGLIINIVDEYTNKNKDVGHYFQWLAQKPYFNFINRRDYGDPSGHAKNAELKSWISLLAGFGISIRYTHSYSIDEMIDCANRIIQSVRICEKQCPKTVEMFENWKYPIASDGKKKLGSKPEHNEFSHPGTAFYYMACNRFGTKQGRLIV